MARYEYMRLQLGDVPTEVVAHYKLRDIAMPDGYIYCKNTQGNVQLTTGRNPCPAIT
jgi:hypothetical protein